MSVVGYADWILPVSETAAQELKNRTLTKLYNAKLQWLTNAHQTLDEAVAVAYGWGDDWQAGDGGRRDFGAVVSAEPGAQQITTTPPPSVLEGSG